MNPSPAQKPALAGPKPAKRHRHYTPPDAGVRAFVYAKACGIIGKSFVGKQIAQLKGLRTLAGLDRLVFPEVKRELPERELILDLEHRLLQRSTRHILSVIKSYPHPPELLIRQLRSCEYADLKACMHHISAGRPAPSDISDIGRFRTVRFNAYPDLRAMVEGTEFESLLKQDLNAIASAGFDFTRLETEIDLHYYTLLVESMRSLSVSDRLIAEQILAEEISLRNCVWAMRLCVYYNKTQKEAAEYLMDIQMLRGFWEREHEEIPGDIHPRITAGNVSEKEIFMAAEAREMLHFPPDDRAAWRNWRWESLLNPEIPGEEWKVDPRYFQNAASRYIYRLCWRCFSLTPFSISAIFCFIKLKQFEEDLLTSVVEGLGLGMTSDETLQMLEAPV
jgi:hypothetical protein